MAAAKKQCCGPQRVACACICTAVCDACARWCARMRARGVVDRVAITGLVCLRPKMQPHKAIRLGRVWCLLLLPPVLASVLQQEAGKQLPHAKEDARQDSPTLLYVCKVGRHVFWTNAKLVVGGHLQTCVSRTHVSDSVCGHVFWTNAKLVMGVQACEPGTRVQFCV